MSAPTPYKSTPVCSMRTRSPQGYEKSTGLKPASGESFGLEGQLRSRILDPVAETIFDPDNPGFVLPEQPHLVEPLGTVRMQVEFYDEDPRAHL